MYRFSTKNNSDPAVVKVDECKKLCLTTSTFIRGVRGCPHGVMVKAMNCGIVVALLRSLSGKYPRERYEPPYSPSNSG